MKLLIIWLLLTPLWAAEPKQVTVQGNCEINVIPDRGRVSFTAENQSKDQKEAVNKTNTQINQLKEKIKPLKLSHLETKNTNYQVFPVREYEKDRYVHKGTRSTLTLEVATSDIARLGEVMALASEVGIQNVGSLQTYLSLEKNQTEYLKCLEVAAEDARLKAMQLASKLGFKIGEVLFVNEGAVLNTPRPIFHERAVMMKGASSDVASTNIEAGVQQFSTTIQVSFGIK